MKRQENTEGATPSNRVRPREAPKKPLSAYNIYFKQERTLLLDSHASGSSPPDFEANLKDSLKAGKMRKSAALFQAASRTIANRWKAMSPDDRLPYEKLAKLETEKYDALKEEYEGERLQQMLLHERTKQVRPREVPESAAAAPSSKDISQTVKAEQSNDVTMSPQHTENPSRPPDDASQEADMASAPPISNNVDAGNLSPHSFLLSGSTGEQSLHSGSLDQILMTGSSQFLTDAQTQALVHHLSGQMLGPITSVQRQGRYLQGQPTGQAFSSLPQLMAHIERERWVASRLFQGPSGEVQAAPEISTYYNLLRNEQQQHSSIQQLQELLRRQNASALSFEPIGPSGGLSPHLTQSGGNRNTRYYSSNVNMLQNPSSIGATGGVNMDNLFASALLTRYNYRQSDLQVGFSGDYSSNAFRGTFSPESGVASLYPQGDNQHLQQLQYLLNMRNRGPADLDGNVSREAFSLANEQTGTQGSSAFTPSAQEHPADTVRRQLHALLSQQRASAVASRYSNQSLLLGDLLSQQSQGSTSRGNPSATVPTAPSTNESADNARLEMLTRLAGGMKNNEGQQLPPPA